MKLVQTIQMMKSEDYHERFKAEYFQLKIRHDRLVETVEKYKAGTLEFTPNCPMEVYKLQLEAMEKYLDVLAIRAKIEGIKLVEPKEKKPKFSFKDYPTKFVMHCKNDEQARAFYYVMSKKFGERECYDSLRMAHRYFRWGEGNRGMYLGPIGSLATNDYVHYGFTTLDFDDFDWSNN